ncbi:MAG: F0F1 ATP synthase subunit delta [Nitrospirota bacterium]
MKLDIWTILFQIVNFAVLLFILQRLLYRPVREVMERRRQTVERNMQGAEKKQEEAEELQLQYRNKIEELERLKVETMETMKQKVEKERIRLMDKAREDARAEGERQKALFETEKRKMDTALREKAVEAAASFSMKMLSDLSNREIHRLTFERLFELVPEIASEMASATERRTKEGEETGGPLEVELVTAYPAEEEELSRLRRELTASLGRDVEIKATVDIGLIAGAKLRAEDKVYDSSLSGRVEALRRRLEQLQ